VDEKTPIINMEGLIPMSLKMGQNKMPSKISKIGKPNF